MQPSLDFPPPSKGLGLRPKLLGGFALVLAMLALTGGAGLFALSVVAGRALPAGVEAASEAPALAIAAAIARLDTLAQGLALTGDTSLADGEVLAVAGIRSGIAARDETALAPLSPMLDRYDMLFAQMAAARRRESRLLTEVLDPLGEAIAGGIAALQPPVRRRGESFHTVVREVLQQFQAVRLTLSTALPRHDVGVATMDQAAAALHRAARRLQTELPSKTIGVARIADDLRSFEAAWREAAGLDAGIGRLVRGELRRLDSEMGTSLQRIVAARADSAAAARTMAQRASADTLNLVSQWLRRGIVAVLACACAAAWLISGRVTRAWHVVAVAMRRAAAGDIDTPIPGAERRDDIGDIARSARTLCATLRDARATLLAQQAAQAVHARRMAELVDCISSFEARAARGSGAVSLASAALRDAANTMIDSAQQTRVAADRASAAAGHACAGIAGVVEELAGIATGIAAATSRTAEMRLPSGPPRLGDNTGTFMQPLIRGA